MKLSIKSNQPMMDVRGTRTGVHFHLRRLLNSRENAQGLGIYANSAKFFEFLTALEPESRKRRSCRNNNYDFMGLCSCEEEPHFISFRKEQEQES
jgi:hypothetical protein